MPSGRGELEITDVNNHYVAGLMAYDVLEGFWGDAGESIDAYYEVNDFVRAHGANKPRATLSQRRSWPTIGAQWSCGSLVPLEALLHTLGHTRTIKAELGQDLIGFSLVYIPARNAEDPV